MMYVMGSWKTVRNILSQTLLVDKLKCKFWKLSIVKTEGEDLSVMVIANASTNALEERQEDVTWARGRLETDKSRFYYLSRINTEEQRDIKGSFHNK